MVADASAQTRRSGRFRVEPMRVEHIPVVSAIERRCFPQPWPQNAYRREIQSNKMAHYFVVRLLEGDDAGPVRRARDAGPRAAKRSVRPALPVAARAARAAVTPALEAELRSIVGYAGIWLMTDEAHITTIAVDPDFQGNGLGELLLVALIDRAPGRSGRAG